MSRYIHTQDEAEDKDLQSGSLGELHNDANSDHDTIESSTVESSSTGNSLATVTPDASVFSEPVLLALLFALLLLVATVVWHARRILDFFETFSPTRAKSSSRNPASAFGWLSTNAHVHPDVEESFVAGSPSERLNTPDAAVAAKTKSPAKKPETAKSNPGRRPGGGHRSFKPPPPRKTAEAEDPSPSETESSFTSANEANPVNPGIQELFETIHSLEQDKRSLERDNLKLKAGLELANESKSRTEQALSDLTTQLSSPDQDGDDSSSSTDRILLDNQLLDAKAEIATLQKSIQSLESQIEETKVASVQATNQSKEARSEVTLRLKDEQLKREVAEKELHIAVGQAKTIRQSLHDAEKKLEQLSKTEQELKTLTEEQAQLKAELIEAEKLCEKYESSLARTESLQTDFDRLKERSEAKEIELADTIATKTEVENQLAKLSQDRQESLSETARENAELQLQFSNAEQQIDELALAKSAVDQTLTEAQSNLKALEEQLKNATEESSEVKNNLTASETQITELNESLATLESESSELKEEFAKANESHQKLEQLIAANEKESAVFQKQFGELHTEKTSALSELAAMTKARDLNKSEAFKAASELAKLNEEMQAKQDLAAELKDEITTLKAELQASKDHRVRVSKEATEFAHAKREVQDLLEAEQAKLILVASQKDKALTRVDDLEQSVSNLNLQLADANNECKTLETAKSELIAAAETAHAQTEQAFEAKSQQLTIAREVLSSQVELRTKERDDALNELADQKKTLDIQVDQFSTIERQLEDFKSQLVESNLAKKRIADESQATIAELKQRLDEAHSKSELQQAEAKKELASMANVQDELLSKIADTENQLSQSSSKIVQKEQELTQLQSTSQSGNNVEREQANVISSLESELEKSNQQHRQIVEELFQEKQVMAEITSHVQKQEAKLKTFAEQADDLQAQLNEQENLSKKLADANEALKSNAALERTNSSSATTADNELRREIEELKALVDQKESDAQEISKRLSLAITRCRTMEEQVGLIEVNEASYEKLVVKAKKYKAELEKSTLRFDQVTEEKTELRRIAKDYRDAAKALTAENNQNADMIADLERQRDAAVQRITQVSGNNGVTNGVATDHSTGSGQHQEKEISALAQQRAKKHVLELKGIFEARLKKKNAMIRRLRSQLDGNSSGHELDEREDGLSANRPR